YGWKKVTSPSGETIGLECPHGKISLEPGSQVECAVSPQETLLEVARHLEDYDRQVDQVIQSWKGLKFLGLAVNPLNRLDQIDLIPSPRYHIMTEVLGKTGCYGTTMMRRTSSVQINLDYTSEKEAIEMLRVSLLLAPISTALFANSPFLDGKPSGFLSTRSEIWRNTDPMRTGLLNEAFTMGFDFEAYAKLLWNLPLMFVQNDQHEFVNANLCSLKQIAEGKLPGVSINPINCRSAVQQLFTEARLKPGYVEVRSVDGQLPAYRLASAAFWMGILYDQEARKKAFELLGHLSAKDRNELLVATSIKGLKAEFKELKVLQVAQALVSCAEQGLIKRGKKEESFLSCLKENVSKGLSPADKLLESFDKRWNRDILQMLKSCHLTIEKTVGEA
ncbi:MAG: hypothetical protein EB120_00005, partial [Proteobacteria bacterium]|nr:hypothetical protein [Pseudomonadota bacterium]